MKLVKVKTPKASPTSEKSANSALLDALNDVQRNAAGVLSGPLLILAGAGSGKTRVLTYRIAYLIERGVAPYNILALTFTNKAANEMKTRIAHVVGENEARLVWAGTFHSVFARILRREADALGYTNSFTIYDSDDSVALVRTVMNSLGISQQQFSPQSVFGRISSEKNKMITWEESAQVADSLFEKQAALVYQEYEKRLRQNNAMDFDDLLLNMIRLFKARPDILERYHEHFRYILVDEYQDTNRAQYIAVNLLASKYRNLCVVGDDAQSIYRWRGADIRNILDFQRDYADAEVVRLEQNYRSTKTILSVADDVIACNSNQLKKKLWTENETGDLVQVIGCRDDREEAEMIVQNILEEVRNVGRDRKDFAILYRTNAQSQQLEDALRRWNMPYTIVGGVSFYKRKEVKDALAYLRVAVNQQDSESVLRIVNEPPRGLGKTSLQHLADYAQKQEIPLFQAFRQADSCADLQKRAQQSALNFAALVGRFIGIKDQLPLPEFVKTYLEASGLVAMYAEDHSTEAQDRWNNIQRLIAHTAEYAESHENPTLEQYLEEIALITDLDKMDNSNNHVTLMTLHSAKGLEFPVVFIAGLERGLFPFQKAEQNPDEMEEERRLFYVGVTRAEKKLFLTFAEKRFRFGELTYSRPSQFIDEIRPELLNFLGTARNNAPIKKSAKLASMSWDDILGIAEKATAQTRKAEVQKPFFDDIPREETYSQIPSQGSAGKTTQLRQGMRVYHEMFGEGKVQFVIGSGDNAQVEVYFGRVGRKKLMQKFAKLKIIG